LYKPLPEKQEEDQLRKETQLASSAGIARRHAKRECPTLEEDKKVGAVKRHPWRKAEFKGKEEDRKKKTDKAKLEKVKVAKQEESGSDSSWFVRDAGESLEEGAEWVTGDGIDDEDTSEAKDEAPKNQENSITYFTRQSSTKPEAVRRYVDPPMLNHCVQSLTPLYIPGHEKRDVKIDTNLEGRYDDGKKVERQEYK
jgi:hypothetical protein